MKRNTISLILLISLVFVGCGRNEPEAIVQKPIISHTVTAPLNNNVKPEPSTPKPSKDNIKPEPSTPEVVVNKPSTPISDKPTADPLTLSSSEKNWYYSPKTDGTSPAPPKEVGDYLQRFSGYYLGDTTKKINYLTFDEGYENGYTSKMLDILKANNVQASFFVTTPYINDNKDLIKRMVAEGHLVCNHSTTHPSMAGIRDRDKFNAELITCENTFETLTGTKMKKFFRPPMGKYSELSMYYTQQLGYKSVFWSFAYADWDTAKQPSEDYAKNLIMQRTHNGGILLLHAVSKTNANILDYLLKEWTSKGFEFKTLNELPM
ncbi:MAG: delta-lactam-biosynthetic de-N-acetylase [Clostridiaceae bacterium]|nr:delta-lactam-biosynthetic de-N-acetylase [Clostridiaceae bacterium]